MLTMFLFDQFEPGCTEREDYWKTIVVSYSVGMVSVDCHYNDAYYIWMIGKRTGIANPHH